MHSILLHGITDTEIYERSSTLILSILEHIPQQHLHRTPFTTSPDPTSRPTLSLPIRVTPTAPKMTPIQSARTRSNQYSQQKTSHPQQIQSQSAHLHWYWLHNSTRSPTNPQVRYPGLPPHRSLWHPIIMMTQTSRYLDWSTTLYHKPLPLG